MVIRCSAIDDKFPGGEEAFLKTVPNETLCSDTELVRVGFMTPADVGAYIEMREESGLVHVKNGEATDLVVVDQMSGFTTPCSWAEAGRIPMNEEQSQVVTACRLKGSTIEVLMHPDGWKYEESLSNSYGFVPSEHVDRSLIFLRNDKGVDVYMNTLTGEEVYVGRTSDRDLEIDA